MLLQQNNRFYFVATPYMEAPFYFVATPYMEAPFYFVATPYMEAPFYFVATPYMEAPFHWKPVSEQADSCCAEASDKRDSPY